MPRSRRRSCGAGAVTTPTCRSSTRPPACSKATATYGTSSSTRRRTCGDGAADARPPLPLGLVTVLGDLAQSTAPAGTRIGPMCRATRAASDARSTPHDRLPRSGPILEMATPSIAGHRRGRGCQPFGRVDGEAPHVVIGTGSEPWPPPSRRQTAAPLTGVIVPGSDSRTLCRPEAHGSPRRSSHQLVRTMSRLAAADAKGLEFDAVVVVDPTRSSATHRSALACSTSR